jgi:hypothetical protein
MGLDFLERRLLERVLAPPPALLFRERQLERAFELAREKVSFVVYARAAALHPIPPVEVEDPQLVAPPPCENRLDLAVVPPHGV